MTKIKKGFFRGYNAIIAALLSLLGFTTACEQSVDEYGVPMPEYGAPSAEFVVKGTVKSAASSSNIPNIKVKMGYDSTKTDAQGRYEISTRSYAGDQTFLVTFEDIDGAENGAYADADTNVVFEDPQFTGGDGGWDQGHTEKEINIRLNPEE
jgi:putative lipoprotein (rSAM/lipoprotein system)